MIRISSNQILILLISVSAIVMALVLPEIHDYSYYLKHWEEISSGKESYNAYGIVYNYFAYLNLSSKVAIPRAIFILIYLVSGYQILRYAKSKNCVYLNWVLIVLFLNPILWVFLIKYGCNDSFLAGMTALSICAFIRDKKALAGVLLGIATAFKFMPIFIAPFLMLKRSKVEYRFSISYLLSTGFFFVLGYVQWGESILKPLVFGSTRPSKLFSVFRFIRGELQPLEFMGIVNLDDYSTYAVIITAVVCFLIYYIYRLDRYLMLFLTLSMVFLVYKVGHHQFYATLLILNVLIYIHKNIVPETNSALLISNILLWIWVFFFIVLYDYTGAYGHGYRVIREFLGLPSFLIQACFNFFLLRYILKKRKHTVTGIGYENMGEILSKRIKASISIEK